MVKFSQALLRNGANFHFAGWCYVRSPCRRSNICLKLQQAVSRSLSTLAKMNMMINVVSHTVISNVDTAGQHDLQVSPVNSEHCGSFDGCSDTKSRESFKIMDKLRRVHTHWTQWWALLHPQTSNNLGGTILSWALCNFYNYATNWWK